MTGKFITFEGIEGCGKTTQINLLNAALQKKGVKTVLTREPGGTKIGDDIRAILLDAKNKELHPVTELLLYEASRRQHLEQLIRPAIAKGLTVLCDRFSDSTIAYQGAARKIDKKTITDADILATGGLKPDLTIVIDIEPAVGLERAKKRSAPDRFEQEKLEFHERVRQGYLKLAKDEPKRVFIVDGSRSVEEIHGDILKLVSSSQ